MPTHQRLDLPSRAELLPKIESGELEFLDFRAQTYKRGKNRNFLTFKDSDLPTFAKSFEGQPFQRDHDLSVEARDGTIIQSDLQGDWFIQDIRLTTRRGMIDFLEGKIDRFSIGWFYDDIFCTVCSSRWVECPHIPGREYQTDSGRKTCELQFSNPKGKECSSCIANAVEGTQIIERLNDYKLTINSGRAPADDHTRRVYKFSKGESIMKKVKIVRNGVLLTVDESEVLSTDVIVTEAASEEQLAAQDLQGASEHVANLQLQAETGNEILIAQLQDLLDSSLATSKLPEPSQAAIRKTFAAILDSGKTFKPSQLKEAIKDKKEELAALNDAANVAGVPARGSYIGAMFSGTDQYIAALADLYQAPRPEGLEHIRVRPLSGIREAYMLGTGDYNMFGGYHPDAALVSVNFPAVTADLLNKVLMRAWEDFKSAYGWWEDIVTVEKFNNLNDVKWIKTGNISSLPTITERGEYQELPIGDNKESSAWGKSGGYIPITLEAILKDDVRAFIRLPREAALAGRRNISEKVAEIFTQNSGAGPTLADGGALFNATAQSTAGGHANLLTTALGTTYAAWKAISDAMYNQRMLVKNADGYRAIGKKQAIRPKFILVPTELKDAADTLFLPRWASAVEAIPAAGGPTYAGMVTVKEVPEFTDANDYAAVADPKMIEGVMLGHIFGLIPQLFSASSEVDPAMFANDESRLKVRQFLNVGVADYRGLHKSNVA